MSLQRQIRKGEGGKICSSWAGSSALRSSFCGLPPKKMGQLNDDEREKERKAKISGGRPRPAGDAPYPSPSLTARDYRSRHTQSRD